FLGCWLFSCWLFGCWLFGCWLFGCWLFGCWLFGCWLFSCWLFGCWLFGCWLFGRGLFSCWLFSCWLFSRWLFSRWLFSRWLFSRNDLLHSCFFSSGFLLGRGGLFRSCHFVLLDQVAKSTSSSKGLVKRFSALKSCECIHVGLQRVEFSEKPCPPRRGAESRVLKGGNMCGVFRAQSQDRAPPVWYSITRVSKKLRSFLRSIISLIQGNGFSSCGNKASSPICVARRFAI
ncbi:MAG: hypothetical protein RJA56_813, partial [Pseudomonadota bacterium]